MTWDAGPRKIPFRHLDVRHSDLIRHSKFVIRASRRTPHLRPLSRVRGERELEPVPSQYLRMTWTFPREGEYSITSAIPSSPQLIICYDNKSAARRRLLLCRVTK